MRQLGTVSLVFASLFAISTAACDGGGSGGTAGSGGAGASGGATTTGGAGGTGGAATGGATTGGGGSGGSAADMALTSPDATAGAMMPTEHTCAGQDTSPQLDWTAGPPGTQSYAVVFEDETIQLLHWAIRDIAAGATGLPANVEKAQNPANVPGATQSVSYDGSTYGYLGPCPNGNLHTYTFTVYALDVAKLPIAGIGTAESVRDLAVEHALATATLTVQSDAKK